MQITADINKIYKTVQCELTFILNVLSQSSIHSFIVLVKKMLLSHKVFFIENEPVLLSVTMRERATAFATAVSFITL